MPKPRKTVFLSYAHEDRKWADELTKFLAPWIRDKRVDYWNDSRIQPGQNWKHQIDRALDEATVAVLLVTQNLLSSDFVMNYELPTLLKRAEKGELRLVWIAVENSSVGATELAKFQAVNDPSRPLEALSKPQRNAAMVAIAAAIGDALTLGTFAQGLQVIDETTEPIQAAVERRPERGQRQFGVQAQYEPAQERISFTGTTTTITFADLAKLPDEDREFIADLEDSLKKNYERWSAVRKGLGDAGGALDIEVENQISRITKLICGDLNDILDFLRKMYKYDLEDHYGRYRDICSQLKS